MCQRKAQVQKLTFTSFRPVANEALVANALVMAVHVDALSIGSAQASTLNTALINVNAFACGQIGVHFGVAILA